MIDVPLVNAMQVLGNVFTVADMLHGNSRVLVVLVLMALYRLPDGSGSNRKCPGWIIYVDNMHREHKKCKHCPL